MSRKRSAAKYTLAALTTAFYGAAAYKAYTSAGAEREPLTQTDVRNILLTGGALSAVVWICAAS